MRLAFADLHFSWPPRGGADVDVFHLLVHLQHLGHEVRLFGLRNVDSWECGDFAPEALPFPAERIELSQSRFTEQNIVSRMRTAIDAWHPEAVWICDGFFLIPSLVHALAAYPIAVRLFAHELACHRNILRFKDGAVCPNSYLETPDLCRACALDRLGPDLKQRHHLAWHNEYLAARAYAPDYFPRLRDALARTRSVVVYNEVMASLFRAHCPRVDIVSGGVNPQQFAYAPPVARGAAPAGILMAGRAEDPAKGLAVLLDAGARLAARRSDFVVWATLPEDTEAAPWFLPVGWQSQDDLRALFREAAICVVPSLWDEPFGLVALEAMATGRPVCASDVGGLGGIVANRETGFVFPRGDAAELAAALNLLLDNPDMRAQMGAAGRRRVEERYDWRKVVARDYTPILDALAARGAQ